MTNLTLFTEDLLATTRLLSAHATERAQNLKAEAAKAAYQQQVFHDLATWAGRGWVMHLLALREKHRDMLAELERSADSASVSALEAMWRIAEEKANQVLRRYPAYLEDACTRESLRPDRESRHPQYTFASGFFRVEIDERKQLARLSDHEGRLFEFPADVEAVIEAVTKEHKRVFLRSFDGQKIFNKLHGQYVAILRKTGQPDGNSVPIRQITRRLGKNEEGFRTDEFLVDLSHLVEQGPLELNGWRLDLQQTKDANQGILLLGAAGARGYVGFVTFKRV